MKEIKYTIVYCMFVKTFVIIFYYGSGFVTNYVSGSNFLTSDGSGYGSTRQKLKSYDSYVFGSGFTTLDTSLENYRHQA
jgi:hypothetical protein